MRYQRKSDGAIANIFRFHHFGKFGSYRAILIEEQNTGKVCLTVVKGFLNLTESQLNKEWEKLNA